MCFFKRRKKVGLVLGSGGARGLAHIGVIKSLVNNKVPIDLIVGSSAGALIGAFYSLWGDVEKMEKLSEELNFKSLARVLFDPNWEGGLIKGGKTEAFFRKYFSDTKIEDLKTPFRAVATDIASAETVVFSEGDVVEAIRASISVPLIYAPVTYKNRLMVDGGVSSPVPVEVAKEMGAEIIIAVNLDGNYFSTDNRRIEKPRTTLDILKDSYYALRYNLAKKEMLGADVVIEPEMEFVFDLDFISGKKAVKAGEMSTEKEIEKIKKLIF